MRTENYPLQAVTFMLQSQLDLFIPRQVCDAPSSSDIIRKVIKNHSHKMHYFHCLFVFLYLIWFGYNINSITIVPAAWLNYRAPIIYNTSVPAPF